MDAPTVPAAATWMRFSSQVDEQVFKRLKRYAFENDIEIREAINEAFREFLDHRGF